MFASNFPVDGRYSTFGDLFAAFDTITAGFDPNERSELFADTARRFYRTADSPVQAASFTSPSQETL